MIALIVSLLTAVLALLIPSRSPYSRIWRPSFLLSAFSVIGLTVTWMFFTFDGLNPSASLLYAVGTFSFFLADAVTSFLMKGDSSERLPLARIGLPGLVRSETLIYIYAGLAIIGTVLILYVYRERSGMFTMFDTGVALRYAESTQLTTYGAHHFLLFTGVLGSLLVLNDRPRMRLFGYACFAVSVFSSFVSVTRTGLFFSLGALAFLMYARTGRLRSIAWPVAGIAILTFAYALFADKAEATTGESFFVWYAGYAIYAFSYYILPLGQWDWGLNSFGILGSLMQGGISPEDLSLLGTQYNVYSFIGAPYRDFGTAGVILLPFLFGTIWSIVWNKTGKKPLYLFMYAWMTFPCIIPFFDWKFNLTTYLYLIPIYLVLLNPRLRGEPMGRIAGPPLPEAPLPGARLAVPGRPPR
jgi:oligosaccharide repeat unit polymerase